MDLKEKTSHTNLNSREENSDVVLTHVWLFIVNIVVILGYFFWTPLSAVSVRSTRLTHSCIWVLTSLWCTFHFQHECFSLSSMEFKWKHDALYYYWEVNELEKLHSWAFQLILYCTEHIGHQSLSTQSSETVSFSVSLLRAWIIHQRFYYVNIFLWSRWL